MMLARVNAPYAGKYSIPGETACVAFVARVKDRQVLQPYASRSAFISG